ncbi:esterase/lipase family protein [Streptomyces sp. NPDC058953]|uniref:esterase/lipase family protein n=1 Tax=Streptomyces sp. NPDC058953 TaxID=3346676 RepID=UPI0036ACF05D
MQVLSFISGVPRSLTNRRTVEQLWELCEPRMPSVALRSTALELAILAGHLMLYPAGLTDERPARAQAPDPADPAPRAANTPTAPGAPKTAGAAGAAGAAKAPTARRSREDGTPEPRPVLMLHGFVDNRSVFVLLRRSLARHGWRDLQCLNYSPLTCDIHAAAELLGRHVEEVCARTGRDGVDLVGHSLGGLIARYYAQCLGGDLRVRNVVTLGTPHTGTSVVPLASAHPIVRQMRPDSPLIAELSRPAPGCRTRFISFWSELDQWMVPLETAQLHHPDLWTENVRVSGIGHLALPVHPAVAARIREALTAPGGGARTGSSVRTVTGEPVRVA